MVKWCLAISDRCEKKRCEVRRSGKKQTMNRGVYDLYGNRKRRFSTFPRNPTKAMPFPSIPILPFLSPNKIALNLADWEWLKTKP